MRILGIESSCDETAAAVVEDGPRLRSNVIASQVDLHARFGGVVPEIASRLHVERMNPVIQQALDDAGVTLEQIEGIAVTNRPGLIGSLLVGVCAAKALAFARGLPLAGVHHIEGHIFANFLADGQVRAPAVALIASGGHTDLYYVRGPHDYQVLGRRRDDAAGEAFDKGARALGLGNAGGAALDQLARAGDPARVRFPRALMEDSLDFSFSGLKTALLRFLEQNDDRVSREDVAASFQQAIVDVLVAKALRAASLTGVATLLVGGGVAANTRLQEQLRREGGARGLFVSFPPRELCTDNAAMIAAAGHSRLAAGLADDLELETFARSPLTVEAYPG
jgi:tRNA N6-adenosine threonylcarbamoyltransferase